MRLLVTTQAVDLDDPVLGFFHNWIEALAKHAETVHVICLKEGRHSLPKNVFVHSLGKEGGRSRFKYVSRFYRYIRALRGEYDSVFVHMNQEYVLLGGVLWRAWGKRVVLWRNHKMGSWLTTRAVKLSQVVCYTSPSAFVASFQNAVRMPIGIDTIFFAPGQPAVPDSILFLGRLDSVKRVDTFVRALDTLHEQGVTFSGTIIGDPTEEKSKYAHDVRNLAAAMCLEGVLTMKPAVTNAQARDLFRSNAIYVNLTPSGSFDKTIGEAMACGCVVVAQNNALKDIVPEQLMPKDDSDRSAADAIKSALTLDGNERHALAERSRAYIEREHSLMLLTEKLAGILRGSYVS